MGGKRNPFFFCYRHLVLLVHVPLSVVKASAISRVKTILLKRLWPLMRLVQATPFEKCFFFSPVHSHLGKAVLWLKRFSISPIFFFKSLTNFCTNAFVYRHAHGGNSILFFFHFFSLFAWIVFCVCVCVFADKRWRTFRSSKKKRQWKKTQSLRHDIPPDWNRIDRIGLRPKNFKVSLSHFLFATNSIQKLFLSQYRIGIESPGGGGLYSVDLLSIK